MSFLTEIGNYARKAKSTIYEWVGVQNPDAVNSSKKTPKNSMPAVVQQKNPGKNEDEFVKVQSGEKANETKIINQGKSVGYVDQLFKNVCNAAGADFVKIKELLNGKNKAFDNLNDTEKIQKYEALIAALGLVKQMKAEGRFNEKTDVNAWVVKSAELQKEVSEIKRSELFNKNLELTEAYENEIKEAKSNADVLNIVLKKRAQISKSYLIEIGKIAKSKEIPSFEKLSRINNLQKERSILMKNMYLSVTATIGDNDKLFFASRTVDSKDAHYAVRTARETRLGHAAKTDFSDNITFEKMCAVIKSYAGEVGQAFNRESVRNFNTEITLGKSVESLREFNSQACSARINHENGTKPTPELDGLYGGVLEGIGAGATLNGNFKSPEDKVNFLKEWEEKISQFSDYEEILAGRKQAVEEYIQKYAQGDSQLVKHIEEIESKFEKIIEQKKAERKEEKENKNKNEVKKAQAKEIKKTPENNQKTSTNPVAQKSAPIINVKSAAKTSSSVSSTSVIASYNTADTKDDKTIAQASSSEVIQAIIKQGYSAAPESKRLILVLTNPLLENIADTDEKVNQDIRNICNAEYLRPAMFGKAKIRQKILKYANPKIQDDLYAMVKGKVGFDFDKINEDKYSKDNEKEHKSV